VPGNDVPMPSRATLTMKKSSCAIDAAAPSTAMIYQRRGSAAASPHRCCSGILARGVARAVSASFVSVAIRVMGLVRPFWAA
jgi:hypothetical protein